MSKKILVTGGAGYIGSHNVKALCSQGFDVVVLDNLSTGNAKSVKNAELVVGDLADRSFVDELMKKHNFDAVMHFAGSIKVPESVENPIKYYSNNTRNSLNLIEACKENNINNFIFSSTAATYGELGEDGVARETNITAPINPYGKSKLMTEWMLRDYADSNEDFNFVCLRYFNVCGASLDGEIGQAFPEPFHLINIACEAAVGKRSKMSIFGTDYETEDGTCIRDYIHVADLANAHVMALNYLLKGNKSDVFNCGYGHGYSVKQVVDTVKKVTKVDFTVEIGERRAGDPAVLVSNADKIKKTLNWKPKYDDLELIIKTAYEWEASDTLKDWLQES
jgi:UDP-glucose 4-epimerase